MTRWGAIGVLFVIFSYASSQLPPRFQIPGAIPLGAARQAPIQQPRRQNSLPPQLREVRPVIEEVEEPNYPSQSPSLSPLSRFDEAVNKLGLNVDSFDREDERPAPLPFRPERPVPIARDQIREKPVISRPPPPPPQRPVIRQELRDEPPIRQPIRQQSINRPNVPVQNFRSTPAKLPPRQQAAFEEDEETIRARKRKPVSQILKKYRTDNEDGSITWGFENDDGTFKEENIGADCIIRGKYGYVDPDGVKREYVYESGNKCEEPELDDEDLEPQRPNIPQIKPRPTAYNNRAAAQPQYLN